MSSEIESGCHRWLSKTYRLTQYSPGPNLGLGDGASAGRLGPGGCFSVSSSPSGRSPRVEEPVLCPHPHLHIPPHIVCPALPSPATPLPHSLLSENPPAFNTLPLCTLHAHSLECTPWSLLLSKQPESCPHGGGLASYHFLSCILIVFYDPWMHFRGCSTTMDTAQCSK